MDDAHNLSLDSMKQQLNQLIRERKVTTMDLDAVATLALLDIAESLRGIQARMGHRDGPR